MLENSPLFCLGLILARASNGVIGLRGQLPWHVPQDLAHFRHITRGWPVIMGRLTWQSLPARFRPLPDRLNIVLSRNARFEAPGARLATNMQQAIAVAQNAGFDRAWVIGGAQVYAQALPLASVVELTEIGRAFEGDAFAPELPMQDWCEISAHSITAEDGLPVRFVRLQRRASSRNAPPSLANTQELHR